MPRSSSCRRAPFGAFRIGLPTRKEKPMPPLLPIVAALPLCLMLAGQGHAQAEKPLLTVYTYSGFTSEYGPGALIKERFEAGCGCRLEWVTSDDAGTLLARLKLEGESTGADVVLGLDTNYIPQAKATGLFAPHGIDNTGLDLPVEWTDDTFVPFDWSWFAFVYDETKLPDPPESLRALIEAPDGPKIIIQDPRTSSPGLGLLVWMRGVFGEDADEAWRKLAPKIVTVTQGWSEAYSLFLKGEADMVLSYTTSPAYHIAAEKQDQFKAAIFPEGHYLQVEIAGVTTVTDEPELARDFLRFMISDPFQSAIPEGNWMYPAALPEGSLPASFEGLARPETSTLQSPGDLEANRRAWIDEWLAALSR
jgi:thiamine transport system substrate-binding protein